MASDSVLPSAYPVGVTRAPESAISAISWAAILGGVVVTAATSLLLLTLGSGFGLASVSAWPDAGATATVFAVSAGVWLIVVQWISAGLGGYVTGRLRTRWVGLHTHEVFFRDTAHGLLTWATATLIGAAIVASAAAAVGGAATQGAATMASGVAQGAGSSMSSIPGRDYDIDSLFRGERAELASSGQDVRAETGRILANGDVPAADRQYLAQVIATRTGVAPEEAQKRVDAAIARAKDAETKARQAAETARKSASAAAIFAALSLLVGAFIASVAAAYGGSLRDEHP